METCCFQGIVYVDHMPLYQTNCCWKAVVYTSNVTTTENDRSIHYFDMEKLYNL